MRLLIISDMAHYQKQGTVVGHGATVREINYLADLFDSIRHIGCLYETQAPANTLPYKANIIEFIPVPPSGGSQVVDKLEILLLAPQYLRTIYRELKTADIVHVRTPANIPLLALLLLAVMRRPSRRWVKYGGSWRGEHNEPLSFRFQRWWLRRNLSRCKVTVNGVWQHQKEHVHSFPNPCLTEEELKTGALAAANKELSEPINILYVGSLNEQKGIGRALEVVRGLIAQDLELCFDVVGDGDNLGHYQDRVENSEVESVIRFHGRLSRAALNKYYEKAHILLLPSASEGWPKVISEAMAYGVVPVAGSVGSIGYYLGKFEIGRTPFFDAVEEYIKAIIWYAENDDVWHEEAKRAVVAAKHFSYDAYLKAVRSLLLEDGQG